MTATSDIHLNKFITFNNEETTAFSFGILQKAIKSKAQRMVLPNCQTMKDMGADISTGTQPDKINGANGVFRERYTDNGNAH